MTGTDFRPGYQRARETRSAKCCLCFGSADAGVMEQQDRPERSRCPPERWSPESPEDGQVRCGDAIDAQPDQLVEALAVVDRPRQDQQFVLVHPGNQVRVRQRLKDRYTADGLLERGVGL